MVRLWVTESTSEATTVWRNKNSITEGQACLAVLCFYSKTGFWYCQISTDLDKILHTPIVVRNTLVGRLIARSARGQLQAKPEPGRTTVFFPVNCNAPYKSYIKTTDRRDFGGKPSK